MDQRCFEFIGRQRAIAVCVEFIYEDVSMILDLLDINIWFEVGVIHSNVRVVTNFGHVEAVKFFFVELNPALR